MTTDQLTQSQRDFLTYSAVARVPRSASARASRLDVGLATSILDTLPSGMRYRPPH